MQQRGVTAAWLVVVAACLQGLATPVFAQGQDIQCDAPGATVSSLAHLQTITSIPGCNHVFGDLQIGYPNCLLPCQLSDFTALNGITMITGSLRISCCSLITDLSDFNSLTIITGSLELYYNQELTRISGFQSLTTVGGSIQISQHPKLQVVTGLSTLSTITGFLTVERNTALYDLEGFSGLITIRGNDIQSGHALSLLYNTNITSLSAFRSLVTVAYGTVHIEGNTQLCYAGYPTWNIGSYLPREPVDGGEDVGVDWRTKLTTNEVWQYTWGVEGGGYPTLVVQINAPAESCATASCHSSCPTNAGCLGPNDPSLCGSCDPVGDVNPCEIPGPPTSAPRDSTPVIYGVVFTIIGIIALVLLALGIWLGIVLFKKWKESRQGSFDISLGGIESGRSGIEMISTDKNSLYASKQIAEPTPQGSTATRSGLRSKNIDNIIMASYKKDTNPELSTTVSPRRQTTPSSTPSDRYTTTVKSSPSPVVNVDKQRHKPVKQRHSPAMQQHPITATKAPTSRSMSEPGIKSNTFPSSREMSTESILERMRQQHAEIPMNFPHDQIKLSREIGTGDFGKVYQAEAKKLLPGQKKTAIVVKQLKEGATKQERDTFLRPVEAMKLLQHPNVLSLLGVSMQGPSILVMLEYCSQGNFKTYLVKKRREAAVLKSSGELLKMAINMAKGLMYLHTKNIAHNDFAVRNCLVTSESTVKLGDYGITRQTFKEDYYCCGPSQKAWPIRWMAPEQIVIQGRNVLDSLPVSIHANIWSFGVALWEICSFAQWPYEEMSNEEVIQTLKETGKCVLENPLKASDPISPLFDICEMCWRSAKQRPKMPDILALLGELQKPGGVRKIRAMIASIGKGDSSPANKSGETKKSESLTRPKRPAPKKPPTSKTRGWKGSADEPLIISNPSVSSLENGEDLEESGEFPKTKKPVSQSRQRIKKELRRDLSSSTEPLIMSSGSQSSTPRVQNSQNATHTSTVSKETKRTSPKVGKSGAKSKRVKNIDITVSPQPSEAENTMPPPSPIKFEMEVAPDEAELPLPGEMSEATNEIEMMASKAMEEEREEDDFILEPPERFSQSSLDDIDYDGAGSGTGLEFALSKTGPTDQSFSYYLGPTDLGDNFEEEYGDSLGDHQTGATSSTTQEQKKTSSKTDKGSSTTKVAMANSMWMSEEQEFEEFDRRDALEEDDIPNVIYDEDVAALIW